MGKLVDGVWKTEAELANVSNDGRFVLNESQFRNWVTADGSSGFKGEAGRYHLYVSYACPFAHRTLIMRKLKGLEAAITFSVVDAVYDDHGWSFGQQGENTKDPLFNLDRLHQLYTRALSDYTGKVTVPVLWDKQKNTIVNNESSEIIRMFNSEFKECHDPKAPDFYPADLQPKIDEINAFVYEKINIGVYKVGFAKTQEAYTEAAIELFKALDHIDSLLTNQRYLLGDHVTEADIRLFTTLLRFDPVYVCHFKCNKKRLIDYCNLSRYLKELYNYPGIKETVNFDHIKRHYFMSHVGINPYRIVPIGPELDL